MEEPENEKPKSLNHDTPTYVQFVNNTGRMVNLFWYDYSGKLVRYGDILPRKGTSINTYVTHPWMARDSLTWYPLLLNGKHIFYPEVERGEVLFHDMHRDIISIRIPVFSLFRRCLEEVYLHLQREDIGLNSLPRDVKDMLLNMSPSKGFRDHAPFGEFIYEGIPDMDGEIVDDEDSSDD